MPPHRHLASMDAEEAGDLYDRAVNIVLRDKKCSTSYIQRRLSVGYNKAASLVERMEKEGVVGAPNHSGKRAILVGGGIDRGAFDVRGGGVSPRNRAPLMRAFIHEYSTVCSAQSHFKTRVHRFPLVQTRFPIVRQGFVERGFAVS